MVPGMGADISVLIFISFVQYLLCFFLVAKRAFLEQDLSGLYLKKGLKSRVEAQGSDIGKKRT
jgi:hypothetical protein